MATKKTNKSNGLVLKPPLKEVLHKIDEGEIETAEEIDGRIKRGDAYAEAVRELKSGKVKLTAKGARALLES